MSTTDEKVAAVVEQARRLLAREESPEYARPTPTEWRHIAVALVAAADLRETKD